MPDREREHRGWQAERQQVDGDARAGQDARRFERELIGTVPGIASDHDTGPAGRRVDVQQPPCQGGGGTADHGAVHPVRSCGYDTAQARRTELEPPRKPVAKLGGRLSRGARVQAVGGAEQVGQLGAIAVVGVVGKPRKDLPVQFLVDHAGPLAWTFGMISARSAPTLAADCFPAASTSAWSSAASDRPAAGLVTSEIPSTSMPRWRAAMASSAVDMPTMSAPAPLSILISAGVS